MSARTSAFAGAATLTRLALRRDRLMLAAWTYALAGSVIATAASFKSLYPTQAGLRSFAASVNADAALRAIYGRVYDETSLGGLTAWRMGVVGAVLLALLNVLVVVRHTRAEEETGRLELVGAAVVGRQAALTAALAVSVLVNLVIAAVVAIGLAAVGVPAGGSITFGLSLAGSGLVFAGVGAVTAQVCVGARPARGLAVAALGVAYLVRAAGDAGGAGLGWLRWLSPIGWTALTRPYQDTRWQALGLAAVAALALGAVAYTLNARRDLGAGLLSDRLGPSAASPTLAGPFALAWRLHRGALAAWAAGMVVFGAVFGSITRSVVDMLNGSEQLRRVISQLGGESGLVNAYLATAMAMVALVVSVYAISATLRLRAEESAGRVEPLLATSVPRLRLAASHLVFPVFGAGLLLALTGAATGLADAARGGDVGVSVGRMVGAALAQWPATLVITGVGVALFGLAPRLAGAGWAAFAVAVLIGQVGPLLRVGQAVLDVSPFTHVPKLPGAAVAVTPLAWLTGVALALLAVGLVGFRRRDIT